MPDKVFIAQFLVLALTAALFAAAFVLGWRHMRAASAAGKTAAPSMGVPARATILLATLTGAALLAWRAFTEKKITLPLSNHFDAFLVLALLLALVLMYLRWTRHLRGLAFFMLPMIAALLVLGGILELVAPGSYHYQTVWDRIHIATVISGSVCFALACVGAIVYLLAARQLKHPAASAMGAPASRVLKFPPLASMEKFNQWMVYLGFPLLTIAMIAGILLLAQGRPGETAASSWQMSPKVGLAVMAWIIYGILLHIPLAPSFRGQRAAWLSIIGFVLFLGGFAAATWMK